MRHPWIIALLAGPLLACGDQSVEAEDDRIAVALLAEVTSAVDDWPTMPGFEERVPARSPHGQEIQVHVNGVLSEALAEGPPWPVGSTAVKYAWAEGEPLTTGIIRRDDTGWFYAQFDAGDRLVASGRAPMCVDCHHGESGYFITAPDPADVEPANPYDY